MKDISPPTTVYTQIYGQILSKKTIQKPKMGASPYVTHPFFIYRSPIIAATLNYFAIVGQILILNPPKRCPSRHIP